MQSPDFASQSEEIGMNGVGVGSLELVEVVGAGRHEVAGHADDGSGLEIEGRIADEAAFLWRTVHFLEDVQREFRLRFAPRRIVGSEHLVEKGHESEVIQGGPGGVASLVREHGKAFPLGLQGLEDFVAL